MHARRVRRAHVHTDHRTCLDVQPERLADGVHEGHHVHVLRVLGKRQEARQFALAKLMRLHQGDLHTQQAVETEAFKRDKSCV